MRTVFPAQELPVRSALTVGVRCVNRTRKHAASVTAYSVLHACPSIQRSTRSQPQQTTEFGSEKGLNSPTQKWLSGQGCLFNFISFICSSVIGTVSGDCHDSPL